MASRQLLIPWIAAAGTLFSPLPCQAWHGYMVTNAHRVEVEVGAGGLASAPLSGAAAAAPPAGALTFVNFLRPLDPKLPIATQGNCTKTYMYLRRTRSRGAMTLPYVDDFL
jgi:hypothetical protein